MTRSLAPFALRSAWGPRGPWGSPDSGFPCLPLSALQAGGLGTGLLASHAGHSHQPALGARAPARSPVPETQQGGSGGRPQGAPRRPAPATARPTASLAPSWPCRPPCSPPVLPPFGATPRARPGPLLPARGVGHCF